jgi:hypothetical protein
MKITKFLMAVLLFVPFLSACLDDISSLEDPRDAIAKKWRATDNTGTGSLGYDVTISKDATELTRVLFSNFHNLATSNKLYATLSNKTLMIPSQTLDKTYTISGTGTISNDMNSIGFTYTINDGDGPVNVTASFGQNFAKKKAANPAVVQ